jgi:hypothetical protein
MARHTSKKTSKKTSRRSKRKVHPTMMAHAKRVKEAFAKVKKDAKGHKINARKLISDIAKNKVKASSAYILSSKK